MTRTPDLARHVAASVAPLIAGTSIHAADVTVQRVAGSGFLMTNAGGTQGAPARGREWSGRAMSADCTERRNPAHTG
ncbi:hypothetical protein [Rudaea cellulosilytica]|uniref:hypothetical protein n=1 Tax=Rudaea cellulosilytica TaxID=540746 RepID=UPI0003A74054|nr:hypothetical protein [Rudaea cellulosilytica]